MTDAPILVQILSLAGSDVPLGEVTLIRWDFI